MQGIQIATRISTRNHIVFVLSLSQVTLSNAFAWMKSFVFRFKYNKSTLVQVWLRAEKATSDNLNQWWRSSTTHIWDNGTSYLSITSLPWDQGLCFNIKTVFSGLWISFIRQNGHEDVFFIIGLHILMRRHIFIDTASRIVPPTLNLRQHSISAKNTINAHYILPPCSQPWMFFIFRNIKDIAAASTHIISSTFISCGLPKCACNCRRSFSGVTILSNSYGATTNANYKSNKIYFLLRYKTMTPEYCNCEYIYILFCFYLLFDTFFFTCMEPNVFVESCHNTPQKICARLALSCALLGINASIFYPYPQRLIQWFCCRRGKKNVFYHWLSSFSCWLRYQIVKGHNMHPNYVLFGWRIYLFVLKFAVRREMILHRLI